MKKLLCLLFLLSTFCFAQTRITPDCVIPFTFSSAQSTNNFTCGAPNGSPNNPGIAFWIVVYANTGFSGLSLTVQSAPDASGVPGAWATFAGTVLTSTQCPGSSGINPNTAITSAFTCLAGYYRWMRVTSSGLTGSGTIQGNLYGYLNSTMASAGAGGGAPSGPAGGVLSGTYPDPGLATSVAIPGSPTTTTQAAGDNSTKVATTAQVQAAILAALAGCSVTSPGNLTCPGSIASGSGSSVTGAFDLRGKTSGATSTITVDDNNTSTQVNLPNDATSGLYAATSPTATPAAGCAQYNGTGTQAASTGTPCGAGGGGGSAGATLFSTTGSTTVTATSPTTLIGTATGSTTIAANTFTAGQILEFVAQGYYTTPATPASLTITLNIGGTIRITTGAVVQIASVTTGVWRLRCAVTTRTAGSSGTQIANCIFEETGATLTPGEAPMQTSSTWTIDTTATQAIDLVATWSTATGAPTLTSTNVAAWIPGAPVTSVNGLTGAVVVPWNNVRAFDAPPTAGWTGDNATTFDVTNGYPYLHQTTTGAAALGVEYQTAPSAPYSCTVQILDDLSGLPPGSTSGNVAGVGLVVGDSAGKYVYWGTYNDNNGPGLWTSKWTATTTLTGTYKLSQNNTPPGYEQYVRQAKWFQITNDSTNLLFKWSIDGNHWKQFDSRAVGDFLGAITRAGFFAFTQTNTVEMAIPSWKCQ